jgi:hypothetical protein
VTAVRPLSALVAEGHKFFWILAPEAADWQFFKLFGERLLGINHHTSVCVYASCPALPVKQPARPREIP